MEFVKRLPGGWWGVLLPVVTVGCAALLVVSGVRGVGLAAGLAAAAALCVGWFVMGEQAFDDGATATPYLCLMLVCVVVLCTVSPTMAMIQTIAYPYAWSWSRNRARLVVANLLVALAVFLGFALHGRGARGWLVSGLTTAGMSLVFALVMGAWITRIVASVAREAVLRARLDAVSEELAKAHRDAGVAAERNRFAHEIHDTLTQTLTALVMITERARDELDSSPDAARSSLEVAERSARQALAETRSLIAAGQGLGVEGEPFSQRVARVCAQFGEESGVEMRTSTTGDPDRLDRADQVVVLRCLQEILANVGKHAHARHVDVTLDASAGVSLRVRDDGVGFPDAVERAEERGYGLSGIASRLALARGSLDVRTGAGGTTVCVTLPGVGGAALALSSRGDGDD